MNRPADIVSPVTNQIQPPTASFEDARRNGQIPYDKPTPQNSVVLFIDHQIGLMADVRDFTSLAEYKSNVVGLARMANALKMPVLISSSNAQWQNGDILPELKEIFPEESIYRRTGIINCYEDPLEDQPDIYHAHEPWLNHQEQTIDEAIRFSILGARALEKPCTYDIFADLIVGNLKRLSK